MMDIGKLKINWDEIPEVRRHDDPHPGLEGAEEDYDEYDDPHPGLEGAEED